MGETILITGGDGFIASHLIDYLLKEQKQVEVWATVRRLAGRENIKHCESQIKLIDMELTDSYSVSHAIKTSKPDKIFHLAGQTFVPNSWTSPVETFQANAIGSINILEAARREAPEAYIQLASSSETYGLVKPEECPIMEDLQPLRPLSPYGVSKAAVDYLGWQYARSYKMNIVRTRTFNNDGPRRGAEFVTSAFALQIAQNALRAERGEPVIPIRHGNLDAIRDLVDVRDTVRAYWLLSENPRPGDVFNICTGEGVTMRRVLEKLLEVSGMPDTPLELDETRLRPSDVPILVGCPHKIREHIGWWPEYTFDQTIRDLYTYWLKRSVSASKVLKPYI